MESTSQSNIITVASNASNSAFKQAYESATAGKRDYITMVQNGLTGDAHSNHYSDTDERYSDNQIRAAESRMQTIQPRDTYSLSNHQEDDDIYPYNVNPSPQISKPTHVGGLSTSDIDLGGGSGQHAQ